MHSAINITMRAIKPKGLGHSYAVHVVTGHVLPCQKLTRTDQSDVHLVCNPYPNPDPDPNAGIGEQPRLCYNIL